MQSYGNERQVQQGEDWNLDILLSASDKEYIPYIVSSERNNPFFVTTVASTKFEKNLRYVKSFWSDIDSINPITRKPFIPRFYQTTPIYCGELKIGEELPDTPSIDINAGNDTSPENNTNNGVFFESTKYDSIYNRYLYQYTKEEDEIDYELGHKPYYYFYFDYSRPSTVGIFYHIVSTKYLEIEGVINYDSTFQTKCNNFVQQELGRAAQNGDIISVKNTIGGIVKYLEVAYFATYPGKWTNFSTINSRVDDYECRVRYNFPSEVTSEWVGQNYMYQITLVSGVKLADRLNQIYQVKLQAGEITEKEWPRPVTERYKYVKLMWPNELQPDIDIDSPLGRILQPEPILPPTKLEVFNNLRTII